MILESINTSPLCLCCVTSHRIESRATERIVTSFAGVCCSTFDLCYSNRSRLAEEEGSITSINFISMSSPANTKSTILQARSAATL